MWLGRIVNRPLSCRALFSDRHPEVRASKSAFTRVFDALRRASRDERPPPVPLAHPAAPAGPSPFEARASALAPQGDGERDISRRKSSLLRRVSSADGLEIL